MVRALSVSGESKEFFAEARIAWLKKCLQDMSSVSTVMDFGCGTGVAVPFLIDILGAKSVIAIDPSPRIREVAQLTHGNKPVQFCAPQTYQPRAEVDLVFCNGTFHHVVPAARASTIDYIFQSLRPGGLFVLSENNPWNPGTRYVMSRCAFDKNAVPLSVRESHRLVRAQGFEIVRTDFLFVFPRALRWLRGIEPFLARFPIGAQYQMICLKPE